MEAGAGDNEEKGTSCVQFHLGVMPAAAYTVDCPSFYLSCLD